jgi:hypothetical protein
MGVPEANRIEMSQRECDILKVISGVLKGERTQAAAARLLELSTRQIRRLQRKLEAGGDHAIVHGLRGKPSNHQPNHDLKRKALRVYRAHYADFGPTFASEKLQDDHGLVDCPQTLPRWLIEAGLWGRKRRRETHRSRRPRRACFGELVQMDASSQSWMEGRGEQLVLLTRIDHATSYRMARFYKEGTVETHMDLLDRWLRRFGRPGALCTDRHSIFEPQDKGQALPDAETPFGRALRRRPTAPSRRHPSLPRVRPRVGRLLPARRVLARESLRSPLGPARCGSRSGAAANPAFHRLLGLHAPRAAARRPCLYCRCCRCATRCCSRTCSCRCRSLGPTRWRHRGRAVGDAAGGGFALAGCRRGLSRVAGAAVVSSEALAGAFAAPAGAFSVFDRSSLPVRRPAGCGITRRRSVP